MIGSNQQKKNSSKLHKTILHAIVRSIILICNDVNDAASPSFVVDTTTAKATSIPNCLHLPTFRYSDILWSYDIYMVNGSIRSII
jgi:hypothetical protein